MFKKKFLIAMMLFLTFFTVACSTDNDTKDDDIIDDDNDNNQEEPYEGALLYVHYYRFDGEYDDWSLWLWPNEPESLDGAQYFFEETDDFGVVAEIPIEGNDFEDSTEAGIIVRGVDDWTKDIDADRFIDMSQKDDDGNLHIYLVENTVDIYYSEDDVDAGDRIMQSQFTSDDTIEFRTTSPVDEADISILKDDNPVTIDAFDMTENNGTITLSETVDLNSTYHITIDFGNDVVRTSMVRFDGFYDSQAFEDAYYYDGELGAIHSADSTTFRLWAPISEAVTLNLYTHGHESSQLDYDDNAGVDTPYEEIDLTRIEKGVWEATVDGDLHGVYYTFTVTNDDISNEVVDPYAYSTGVNGERGMVVDFDQTNPDNWEVDERPPTITNFTDAIIYEIHVRDYTTHDSWNGADDYRGKFLGLTETGTTFEGVTTGFDHIKDLGVTHVQIIPFFDHGIIDETRLNDPDYEGIHDGIFNWGYMPEHFNTVEGSYSTDPFNGDVRITELKSMIQHFHNNDLRIVMDVVYNHTGKSADSNFDLILPGYYFRMNEDGSFSNGSGTGNETASERAMMRKYIVDSITFWAEEYNIDGFRFDLMKLHDVETMNAIRDALDAIDPTIMMYGEPWTGGTSPLPSDEAAFNETLDEMTGIGVFNDDTRDGAKGSVFDGEDPGFIQGNNAQDAKLLLGVVGGTYHQDLPISQLPKGAWAPEPTQTINYVTAHDNNTLHDKIMLSTEDITSDELIRMQRQANNIILTSQGIPFLHGGVEIMRTKPCIEPDGGEDTCDANGLYDHNSYRSPDETNQIDWQWKVDNYDTFEYYKSMIELRKMKDVFRLPTALDISQQVDIIDDGQNGLIAYYLYNQDDLWKTTMVIHNNGLEERTIDLAAGDWHVVVTTDDIGDYIQVTEGTETYDSLTVLETYTNEETITLAPNETLILYNTDDLE